MNPYWWGNVLTSLTSVTWDWRPSRLKTLSSEALSRPQDITVLQRRTDLIETIPAGDLLRLTIRSSADSKPVLFSTAFPLRLA